MALPEVADNPTAPAWYVVKQVEGSCIIVAISASGSAPKGESQWGPYASEGEAIARRVGLIRAGKCLPV